MPEKLFWEYIIESDRVRYFIKDILLLFVEARLHRQNWDRQQLGQLFL